MGFNTKTGSYIEEKKEKKSEAIRTFKEVNAMLDNQFSSQHIYALERSAINKILIKSAAITGNYYEGFKLAIDILKIRNPKTFMEKLPECIQDRIRSAATLKENALKMKIDYDEELAKLRRDFNIKIIMK